MSNDEPKYTNKVFGEAVAELLSHHQGNPWRISLLAFAEEVGLNYATLRSAVMGRTAPQPDLIERVARTLGIKPEYFREYRLWQMNKAIVTATQEHTELAGKFYEIIMAEIAALDELSEEAPSVRRKPRGKPAEGIRGESADKPPED